MRAYRKLLIRVFSLKSEAIAEVCPVSYPGKDLGNSARLRMYLQTKNKDQNFSWSLPGAPERRMYEPDFIKVKQTIIIFD